MQPPSTDLIDVPEGLAGAASPSPVRGRRTGPAWEPYLYLLPGTLIFSTAVSSWLTGCSLPLR